MSTNNMKPPRLVHQTLIKSPWKSEPTQGRQTVLASADQTSIAIATCRATFWEQQLDAVALEKSLTIVLEDLPFLGGRIHPVKLPLGWKLGDIAIDNNNAGAEFTILDAVPAMLADCGPNTWPMADVTISNPRVPFYIPSMDVGQKLLSGKEPLCKVQLMRLADGCVLGVTLSHSITDGMHWPALMTHIAARYRQVTTGTSAKAEELIVLANRKEGLSVAHLKVALGVAKWVPKPFEVKPTFVDYFRAMGLLWGNASLKIQHKIIFLPKDAISNLKAAIAKGCDEPVTTGDVVQALAALAVHAAEGRPLLPVKPKTAVVLVQFPGPSHFGNCVHPMAVGLDSEDPLPEEIEGLLPVLRAMARKIRISVAELRASPEKALQALHESHVVCEAPVGKAVSFLSGKLNFMTCTTNFIGSLEKDRNLDFGLANGVKPLGFRSMTFPLAKGMAVVRPSFPPYGEGLFLHLNLTAAMVKTLNAHPLLSTLIPDAQFVGAQMPAASAAAVEEAAAAVSPTAVGTSCFSWSRP